jgi:tryptophan-rich sensory protein
VAVLVLLLLVLMQSYTWVICCTRCLGNGMVIGFAGSVWV